MHRCGIDILDEVFLSCIAAFGTYTSTILSAEVGKRSTLDVAEVRNGDNHFIIGIEIFCVKLFIAVFNLCATLIAIFISHGNQFLTNHIVAHLGIIEDGVEIIDILHQAVIFGVQFVLSKTGELTEFHIYNCLRLEVVEFEASHQSALCFGNAWRLLNNLNHFVDVVGSDNQALYNMSTSLSLLKQEASATNHDIVAELDEMMYQLLEIEYLGATVNQCNIIYTERTLQLCHLVQFVQHHVGICVFLYVDYHLDAIAMAQVANIRDTINFFLINKVGNRFHHFRFHHIIWDFGNHNCLMIVDVLDFGFGTNHNSAASGLESVFHTAIAIDYTTCGEIGGFDIVHQIAHFQIGILEQCNRSIDCLCEVVRWHICRHTHSNTRTTVNKQVGETSGQNCRFNKRVVKVWNEVNCVFIDVLHHLLAHFSESSLGVTHCCGAITIDRTHITLPIDKRITQRPVLSHTNHGKINR